MDLQALFEHACQLEEEEREAFLRKLREEDPGQARELEELLASEHRGPLVTKAFPPAPPQDDADEFASKVIERLGSHGGGYSRYKFKGKLAEGGQGAVLRVWDEGLQRHLAMKVMLGQTSEPASGATPPVNSKTLGRFLEEAQVTGQLDHPGIVPVHDLGLDPEGRVFFTMKLVKGETLSSIFEKVKSGEDGWTQTRALGVVLKVCEAMAYAHAKGVIHRDLKPSNIMVGRFGEVFVMDWGLAKVKGEEDRRDLRIRLRRTEELQPEHRDASADADSPIITMDGDVVGTPLYMSPEQANGLVEEMGPHSDVYSVGAILYTLLAGHPPYMKPGMRSSAYTILYRVQEGPPDPLHSRAPRAPAELIAICERAMARQPAQRYRDVAELGAELSAFLDHRVVSAYATGAVAELRKWVERNRPLAAALAAAFVLLVAGLLTALVLRQQAVNNAVLARENASEAQRQEALAQGRANDVLSLSAVQRLEDLERRAQSLWPVVPERVEEYDRTDWLLG